MAALQVIDYGWTGYDIYQYSQVIQDPNCNETKKLDFGITSNRNKANLDLFQNAIEQHIQNAPVVKSGTYRGTQSVTHYFDPATNLWAAIDPNGNFVVGWELSTSQRYYLETVGNIQ